MRATRARPLTAPTGRISRGRASEKHTIGPTPWKRGLLERALLRLATQHRPGRSYAERAVGKLGHAHMFRPALRSVLCATHRWLQSVREAGLKQLWQDFTVMKERTISALLLLFAEMCLGEAAAPWSERVVCSNAAPGGHGLAYARVPREEVAAWSQHACHKGGFSVLHGLYEHFGFDAAKASVMKKAELPLQLFRWSEVARPGFYRHITVEEAAAHVWGLEVRLHWPEALGCHVLHLGDNAAEVSSSARGLSPTRRLNTLRKACAVEVLGGFHPFRLWLASDKNPADRPSRRYGNRQKAEARGHRWEGPPRMRQEADESRQPANTRFLIAAPTVALARTLRRWTELMPAAEGQQTACSPRLGRCAGGWRRGGAEGELRLGGRRAC